MSEKIITEDEFMSDFRPVQNHLDANASWGGCMFETFGKELEHVLGVCRAEPLKVWTVLDAEGATVVTNGYHVVNRMGYLITEVPAPENVFIQVEDPDGDFAEGDF